MPTVATPTPLPSPRPKAIVYPDSDGKPRADNTIQYRYITTIKCGLDGLFRHQEVFVAGDLLWYPVEEHPEICIAPDVLVAFGRPKGDRGSYMQWEEEGIPPQVVVEILSPKNTAGEMADERDFYEEYGVEEYYQFDPKRGRLLGWKRSGRQLLPIPRMPGWVSPRLGVRFELEGKLLRVYDCANRAFTDSDRLAEERDQERARAEQERARAERQCERSERLAARLRELGIDPEDGS